MVSEREKKKAIKAEDAEQPPQEKALQQQTALKNAILKMARKRLQFPQLPREQEKIA